MGIQQFDVIDQNPQKVLRHVSSYKMKLLIMAGIGYVNEYKDPQTMQLAKTSL